MGALYMGAIPFVNGFNFSSILIIPLMIAVIAIIFNLFEKRTKVSKNIFFDRAIFALFISIFISIALNFDEVDEKTVNHLGALLVSLFIFYYAMEAALRKVSDRSLLRGLWIGYVMVTSLGIAEFLIRYTLGFDIGTIIPRPRVIEYAPTFLGGIFRARSTFEESGHFASYILMSGPFLIYYHWYVRPSLTGKAAFILLSLAALFSAFSVSAFIFGIVALFISLFIKLSDLQRLRFGSIILSIFVVIGVISVVTSDEVLNEVFIRKFTGASFIDRNEKFQDTIDLMLSAPTMNFLFGYGPGSYYKLGIFPAISVYLNIFRDFGAFGLVLFVIPLLYAVVAAKAIKGPIGMAVLVGCILVLLYFAAIPNYFYPFFFIPFIFLKRCLAAQDSKKPIIGGRLQVA